MTLDEFAMKMVSFSGCHQITVTASNGQPDSPPPYVAGFAEIETNTLTGEISVVNFAAVADCGTVINPACARVQLEGGIVQSIGYALYENVKYDSRGRMLTDNFSRYHIPTIKDIPELQTEFIESYEPTGPFGAKSLGEVTVHTAAPAIANALFNAFGIVLTDMPFTPEKVLRALHKNER